jgi:hypothetical protein
MFAISAGSLANLINSTVIATFNPSDAVLASWYLKKRSSSARFPCAGTSLHVQCVWPRKLCAVASPTPTKVAAIGDQPN